MTLLTDLETLKEALLKQVTESESSDALDQIRIHALGKKGALTDILKDLKNVSSEERPRIGQVANALKSEVLTLIESRKKSLQEDEMQAKLNADQTDMTQPGLWRPLGNLHPLTLTIQRVTEIFARLGFWVERGPEIEDEFHNFEALNIPSDHPARDMHDTFYLKDGAVLRTHTSPVQIRVMTTQSPPLKILAPGKVFRCDSDVSHSPVFHQIEGLYIDKSVTFSQLKGTLEFFLKSLFGKEKKVRFRPSYFPFTEPSCEVDVACVMCSGAGCNVCKNTGWLEIMGAGMVHHNVLRAVDYDPELVSGFAFGVGIDRLAMLLYKVDDIRLFYENDVRFLSQFGVE